MQGVVTIKPGYVYHIKDSYFVAAHDDMLMRNHEGGAYRPTYMCIKDEKTGLFWAIPMSSRIDKYREIIAKDTEKYGKCVKILIARYANHDSAFLFQNMFPIAAEYISHIHTIDGEAVPVGTVAAQAIKRGFNECRRLHKRGAKVIFTDIDRLEKLMQGE